MLRRSLLASFLAPLLGKFRGRPLPGGTLSICTKEGDHVKIADVQDLCSGLLDHSFLAHIMPSSEVFPLVSENKNESHRVFSRADLFRKDLKGSPIE